jgi:hypothetical protein
MAVARSRSGNHVVTTRLLIGYDGASSAPTSMRTAIRPATLAVKPSRMVAIDQQTTSTANRTRGAKRSTSQPPGIWQRAYVHPNAEST